MYTIRLEEEKDWAEAENLTREAFWNKYHPGCSEHLVLHNFRTRPDFVPALDFVAEQDGRLVAHIMYCRGVINTDDGHEKEVLMFGPISVLPELQGRGLGGAMIRHSMDEAARLGYGAVAITGNQNYYGRFGFVSGSKMGVYYADVPREVEAPFFMVKELRPGYLAGVTGTFREPDGYVVDEAELEAYDAQFPPKEKKTLPTQLK